MNPSKKDVQVSLYNERITQVVGIITFLLLPFLYGYKMETGIEKVDLYFFWLVGLLSWFRFRIDSFDRVDLLFGALLLLAVITTIPQANGDVNSFKILVTSFFSFGIYCFIRSHPSVSDNIIWIIIPSLVLQLILGYWQFFRFFEEPLMIKGSLYNSGYFANWLAPCAVLVLARIRMSNDHVKAISLLSRVGLNLLFCATVFLLFATQARAAILGCLAGVIVILWQQLRNHSKNQWKVRYVVIIILSVVSICAWVFMIKHNSALGRLTIYKVSWRIIQEHLLFGVGSNRFQVYYNLYQAHHFQTTANQIEVQQLAGNTFEAFNFIMQWWAEYGLISLSLGGLFCYFFVKDRIGLLWQVKKMNQQYGYLAALICLLCSGLFSNPFHCSASFFLFISLLASIGRCGSHEKLLNVRPRTSVLKISLIFLSAYFLYFGLTQWKAEIQWKRASSLALFGSIETAIPLYEQAYKNLKNDGRFLYNYGTELAQASKYKLSIPLLQRSSHYYASSNLSMYLGLDYLYTGDYKAAEQNFLNALHTVPSALLPKYQLVQLYLKTNRKDEAAAWITYTLNYPIKIRDDISDKILEELKAIKL